jgi:hypothetical protein
MAAGYFVKLMQFISSGQADVHLLEIAFWERHLHELRLPLH